MENLARDITGREWTADEFALQHGHRLDEIEFARILQDTFAVHGYERMQQLWRLRDRSLKKNPSGSFPEGFDIGSLSE